jgi:hypothetical protein
VIPGLKEDHCGFFNVLLSADVNQQSTLVSSASSVHDFSTVVLPTKSQNHGWPNLPDDRLKSSNGNGLELAFLHGKVKNKYTGVSAT